MPTEEYKGRRTEIYFPSEDFLKKWKDWAKTAKTPLSSWIFETVERVMDDSGEPIQEIAKERSSLQDENRKLRRDLENATKLMEAYKTEAFNLRNEIFLQKDLRGRGQFDDRLVAVLRRGGVWRSRDLLKELDVDAKDVDAIQIVVKQLQTLQDIGVVQEGSNGWRWVG